MPLHLWDSSTSIIWLLPWLLLIQQWIVPEVLINLEITFSLGYNWSLGSKGFCVGWQDDRWTHGEQANCLATSEPGNSETVP